MKNRFKNKLFLSLIFLAFISIGSSKADYPSTSIGVIDLNYILSESNAAKDAAKKIEEIALKIEEEIQKSDQD